MKTILATSLLLMIALTGAACEYSFSTARITEAKLSRAVNEKKEAVNPTTQFTTADSIIHAVVELANAPDDTTVKARWHTVKVEGVEDNYLIAETQLGPLGAKNLLDFTLTPNGKGLPPGSYKVDIFLNPKEGQAASPTRTLNFSIEAAEALAQKKGADRKQRPLPSPLSKTSTPLGRMQHFLARKMTRHSA